VLPQAGREGELGAGKPEDLPIMTDGDAITPSGSIYLLTWMGFLIEHLLY
jgi:hypothetical protein